MNLKRHLQHNMPATLTFDVPKKVDKREEILEILKKKKWTKLTAEREGKSG